MDQVNQLQRANRIWRLISGLSVSMVVVFASIACSQRGSTQQEQPVAVTLQDKQAVPQADQFPTDRSQMVTSYANFASVNVTPEELVVDLGLNPTLVPSKEQPIKMSNRIVMNYYTAKRLRNALHGVVEQHEAMYGPLELDFQKRIKKK